MLKEYYKRTKFGDKVVEMLDEADCDNCHCYIGKVVCDCGCAGREHYHGQGK